MSYRPNFKQVTLSGANVTVQGESPGAHGQMEIIVALQQGTRIAHTRVLAPGTAWSATLPVADDTPAKGPDFTTAEPVLAFGNETRSDPFLAISWFQQIQISVPDPEAASTPAAP